MEVYFAHPDVGKFIRRLNKRDHAEVIKMLEVLEEVGHEMGMPDSRVLERNLLELRISGSNEVRLLYTFFEGEAWILTGFVKKTQKTPEKELDRARYRKSFLEKR